MWQGTCTKIMLYYYVCRMGTFGIGEYSNSIGNYFSNSKCICISVFYKWGKSGKLRPTLYSSLICRGVLNFVLANLGTKQPSLTLKMKFEFVNMNNTTDKLHMNSLVCFLGVYAAHDYFDWPLVLRLYYTGAIEDYFMRFLPELGI